MTASVMRWASSTCVAVLAPALLGGCLGVTDRSVASADPVAVESPVASVAAAPPIRTVKPTGRQFADAGDARPHGEALPTPREIFDFHPPGSKPDAWRQPFVIDPNDGPLAGYVRRMDAELSESNRQTSAAAERPGRKKVCPSNGPAGAISATCGENDVAKRLAQ